MHGEPIYVIASILVLFLGIGLHEYAHCKFADLAGDPTPSYYGRVTLNLFKHFEPVGTLMMVVSSIIGYGIGWGRPAPMNPSKMRNPRWDFFIAVAAGPISNLMQAAIYASAIRLGRANNWLIFDSLDQGTGFLVIFLTLGVLLNLALAFFNLIPFGPLDGNYIVGLLLPEPLRTRWLQFNRSVGMMGLFMVVIFLRYANISLVGGPVLAGFHFLTGVSLGQ